MAIDKSYLTRKGARELRDELDYLQNTRRAEIAERLRFAIEQGDISENADYTATKEEQSFIEGRIIELETILSDLVIIEEMNLDKDTVNIGSTVVISEEPGETEEYMIVGSQESDPSSGRISFRSPIGSALFGKKVGDKVKAETPVGPITFTIVEIR